MKNKKNIKCHYILLIIFLTACQNTQSVQIPRTSWYSSWSCQNIQGTIYPPSTPSCANSMGCFKSDIEFEYCKQEIEEYSNALIKWKSCTRENLVDRANILNQAIHERMENINKSTKSEWSWKDERITPPYINQTCQTPILFRLDSDLECKVKEPTTPLCLQSYIYKEDIDDRNKDISSCQYEITSYQKLLKKWLDDSMKNKNESIHNQINYVVGNFNDRAGRIGCQ